MKNEVNRAQDGQRKTFFPLVAKTKYFRLVLMALVSIAFIGCDMFNKKTDYNLSDLQGKWCKDGVHEYRVFSTDPALRSGYLWGWEWNEDEDVHESDLVPQGDGWFMYRLDSDELLEIHQTDYGWAEIPQENVITVLTSKKMTYNKKGYPKEKQNFTKQLK